MASPCCFTDGSKISRKEKTTEQWDVRLADYAHPVRQRFASIQKNAQWFGRGQPGAEIPTRLYTAQQARLVGSSAR